MDILEGRQIRVALVGTGSIGKSCVARRFVENTFHGNPYNPTQGVDFFSRRITVRPHGTATLILVDIGGLAIDSKMLGIYFKGGVDIVLFMYDVTNMTSLNELRNWIQIIQYHQVLLSGIVTALVGCKADLEHLRTVRLDNHTRFKQEFDIPLSFIISAKSGENVQTCFSTSVTYYVNPDGTRPKVREPATLAMSQNILQPPRAGPPNSIGNGSPNHPITGPVPVSAATAGRRQIGQNPIQGRTASIAVPSSDPNSTVCSIQ